MLEESCCLEIEFKFHIINMWAYMFQKLLIRYLLDAMHCEKNLCENITKTVLGMKDSYGSRECGNTDSNFFALNPKLIPKTGSLRFGNR
jgi:hypothetical protein